MRKILQKKSILMLFLLVCLFIVSACGGQPAAETVADTVLQSSVIYTVASEEPIAGGVAIAGNQILAVGTMEELTPYIAESTVIKDMGDQMIMPGFIDGHTHTEASATVLGVDLFTVDSQEKCAEIIKDFITNNPDKDFIVGGGWYAAFWGGTNPDKKYLDKVTTDIPIVLHDYDHHALWCNSKGLEMAGITNSFAAEFNKNNTGELIVVDANGEPTGYLRESACQPVYDIIPEFKTEDLEYCINIWNAYGVTAVNEMSPNTADAVFFDQLEELESQGRLTVRQFLSLDKDSSEEDILATKERFDSDMVRLNALKGFMDGVGATYTASMLKPYDGTNNYGPEPYISSEEVKNYIIKASEFGLATHFHNCGDKAVRTTLDGYQMALEAGVTIDNRFSMEHFDTTHPDDLTRAAEIGISCNVTPDFLAATTNWIDNPYLAVYDDEVDKELWNYGSLYKSGANVTFGTDSYASSYNPMHQVYRAMERVTNDGKPVGGYLPEEKFTVKEAIQCYTINSAKAIGMQDKLGTLEEGKYADIIVLDHNILTASPDEIFNTQVILTMMDGKVVYEQ